MRGISFLLTYNHDFFGTQLPDGTGPFDSPQELWQDWKTWKAAKKAERGVTKSTHKMEASLESELVGRVHIHWKVDLAEAVDTTDRSPWFYHGVKPDIRKSEDPEGTRKGGRGLSFRAVSNRGHHYVWVEKKGSLYRGSNWQPFRDYRVSGKWLEELWGDGKLDNKTYRALSLKVRIGHAQRLRDLTSVEAEEQAEDIDRTIREVNVALDLIKAPFRIFPIVSGWESSFLSLNFRWKILCLVADSSSGKSNYAESRFENPLVITIEDAQYLDLKEFQRSEHDGVVLDNCNSWQQLLQWRATLQARNTKSKGGQSATNIHSYIQYLFATPFIATVDLDAPDKHLIDPADEKHSNWLVTNTVLLRLPRGEAFFQRDKVPKRSVPNSFSRFASTVKRRRALAAQPEVATPIMVTPPRTPKYPAAAGSPRLDRSSRDTGEAEEYDRLCRLEEREIQANVRNLARFWYDPSQ